MMDMDTHMELSKKTTVLFPPELYDDLANLARQRKSSVGELIRDACRAQYFLKTRDERLALVEKIAAMRLPVGSPQQMKRESVPDPELLP
jgi:hypothetical protein